jgi:hypothetical protein
VRGFEVRLKRATSYQLRAPYRQSLVRVAFGHSSVDDHGQAIIISQTIARIDSTQQGHKRINNATIEKAKTMTLTTMEVVVTRGGGTGLGHRRGGGGGRGRGTSSSLQHLLAGFQHQSIFMLISLVEYFLEKEVWTTVISYEVDP